MNFYDLTSEQALAILSHFKQIAEIGDRKIDAFVKGNGKDKQGEPVFLTTYHCVSQIPLRKYFALRVDGKVTSVKFENGLDLLIELH
jgi:hypothetical protein